jgi:spore coat protein A
MKLTKFKDPLPFPPALQPKWKSREYTYYEVKMKEAKQSLHSELSESTIWGFEGIYPGPIIEVEKGEKVFVKWINDLPVKHLFAIDHTVHGAEKNIPDVRTVVHLHGGPQYVWGCHMLEHEDYEMMRPYRVLPQSPPS